jgi:hypothetical protein
MINTQQIFKLCDNFTIDIDRNDNNLMQPKFEFLINPIIIIETLVHTFRFKLIYKDLNKKTFQIQCIDSFKILLLNNEGKLFFDDYFNINSSNINNSIFYGVYDNIAICFFLSTDTNLILCFNEKLYLKSIDDEFTEKDQTIFLYEEYKYNLKIIINEPKYINIDHQQYIHKIENVKGVFEFISKNYNNLPEKIFIQLNQFPIPFDFFYEKNIDTFLDRSFDLNARCIYRRAYKYESILDLNQFCQNTEIDYFDTSASQSADQLLPKNDEIIIIWTKLINSEIPSPIYFNSAGIYMVSKELIQNKPISYYNKILTLLERKSDQKIFNLFQFSIYTIFFISS